MSFLDDWRKHGGRRPSELGRNSIRADRWDFEWFEQMLAEMRMFDAERNALIEVATETGNGLWADAFFAFLKASPRMVDAGELQPRYQINRSIMDQAVELPEYLRLKTWTSGDAVAAAGACIAIRPDLEQLHDRTKTAQERAEQLQQRLDELAQAMADQRDLDELIEQWSQDNPPEQPDGTCKFPSLQEAEAAALSQQQQDMAAMVEDLLAQAEAAGAELGNELGQQAGNIRGALRLALGKAADDLEQMAAIARMWGLDPGALIRLPADERMALAKRTNTEQFRRMADLFGPMERLLETEQQRRVSHVPEEVIDITLGDDLERVLPEALAMLTHPTRRLEFYRDYHERRLPEYEMEGHEVVARGGIVFCMDNSGSMQGDRELWAKAVGLCLLHLARQQKRAFWGIHFGSASEIKEFDFSESYDAQDVIDFAEFFFNGGTNFVRPLSLALERLRSQYDNDGAIDADIVFATDGMCGVPDVWKTEFLAEMERIGATMWGINIGGRRSDEPMHELCGGKVATIADVLNSGKDIRELFAGI